MIEDVEGVAGGGGDLGVADVDVEKFLWGVVVGFGDRAGGDFGNVIGG